MRTFKQLPNLELLQEWLDYDSTTGIFIWKKTGKGISKKGKTAGTIQKNSYAVIRLQGNVYYQHRLAWKYFYQEDPGNNYIDHINQIKHDNRIKNLRLVNMSENCHNKSIITTNTSGYPGVSWNEHAQKWSAAVTKNYKRNFLGYFDDPKTAHVVYLNFKNEKCSSQRCV